MKINPLVRLAACVLALSQSAAFAQNAPSSPTHSTPEIGASTSAQGVGATPTQGEATSESGTATATSLFNDASTPTAEIRARPLLTGPLSLQKAVEVALGNSPRLRGAQADVDIAIAQVKAARAARKPSISATTFLTGGSENGSIYNSPEGVAPQNLFASPRGAFANQNVMFLLPLRSGGRLGALTRQAQATRGAFEANLQTARLDVALETKTAYRQALLALELQNVAAARQSATAERLKNDRAALEAGRVPQLYVLRDQAEDADAGQETINAARDVELSFVVLRAVMGVQSVSTITLSDSLEPTDADLSDTNSLQTALAARPELQAARSRLESARRGDDAARGASKFQVALMGMADANRARGGSAAGASVGLVIGVPIFDGGVRRAARDEAGANIRKAQADLDALQIQVEREVQSARLSLDAARKSEVATQLGIAAAEEAGRVAALRYESGRATNAEVLDALAALTRARGDLARTRFDVQSARDALERALGTSP